MLRAIAAYASCGLNALGRLAANKDGPAMRLLEQTEIVAGERTDFVPSITVAMLGAYSARRSGLLTSPPETLPYVTGEHCFTFQRHSRLLHKHA